MALEQSLIWQLPFVIAIVSQKPKWSLSNVRVSNELGSNFSNRNVSKSLFGSFDILPAISSIKMDRFIGVQSVKLSSNDLAFYNPYLGT